ncbi:putative amidoligase domain-containing protein [Brevibacillus sp. TJ4]|uniref:putative amidoligase domain-containing protein n=1 Tax=Brevibacillus sp. TJ4 TaxID=3234853 RepID=UPI0037D5CF51
MSTPMENRQFTRSPVQVMSSNAKQAIELLRRPEVVRWLLRISGLPVASGKRKEPGWRTYKISMYQDHVLEVRKSDEPTQWLLQPWQSPSFAQVSLSAHDPELQLVKGLAARGLYAAGIDAGVVTVMAASPHRAKLVNVSPDWPAKNAERFLQKARHWWESRQRLHGQVLQKLGADPEFALRRTENMQHEMELASNYLKVNGTVGCDTTRYREELALHQHPIAELRPEPSEDPDELYGRIREALRLAYKKINDPDVECLAGGMPFRGYPIGGHIHLSGLTPTFALRRKLDAYLALPLVLIEDDGCAERRKRYGFLGDVREKAYGFEYRTLPSWLVHPIVARGVLHLARLIATSHSQLQAQPHLRLPLLKAYYRGDKAVLEPYVRQVWEELRRLPGYQLSAIHLERYFSYLLSDISWPASVDLRKTWEFG